MFLRADHMRDLHVVIINNCRQMIQACPVCSLDDMILLAAPFNANFTAHQIVQYELTVSWHEQPYDARPTFRLKSPCVGFSLRQPAPAIDEWPASRLRRLALGLQL